MLTLNRPEIADAAADVSADIFGDIIGDFQTAVSDRLLRSSHRVLNESAHLARFLLLDIVQRIEVFDFAGEPNRELFGVEFLYVIRATAAFHQRGPGGWD